MPYHCSNSAMSFKRKSAAKSMTFTPAASNSRACAIATPCGVAKNTTSHSCKGVFSGAENASDTKPRKEGNISATGMPSSLREVIAVNSACGCAANMRNNSTPV